MLQLIYGTPIGDRPHRNEVTRGVDQEWIHAVYFGLMEVVKFFTQKGMSST